MTRAEVVLWQKLRKRQIRGYKFRRQFGIGRYITDFYCPKLRLVIEADGQHHNKKKVEEYDNERSLSFSDINVSVIRFANNEIFNNIDCVIRKIYLKISQLEMTPNPTSRVSH